MAKKPPRSGRPTPGGRVTPKGVRPNEPRGKAHQSRRGAEVRPPAPARIDPSRDQAPRGPVGPTRAGHHHGQR